jgi:hypothetical protein
MNPHFMEEESHLTGGVSCSGSQGWGGVMAEPGSHQAVTCTLGHSRHTGLCCLPASELPAQPRIAMGSRPALWCSCLGA